MKPYVICHMCTTIDGKILVDRWGKLPGRKDGASLFESTAASFGVGAWLVGTTTMREFMGRDVKLEAAGQRLPKTDFVADRKAKRFAIGADAKGVLRFQRGDVDGDHVVLLVSERAGSAYLAQLRAAGVSYLFCGRDHVDLRVALDKLRRTFGIRKLLRCASGAAARPTSGRCPPGDRRRSFIGMAHSGRGRGSTGTDSGRWTTTSIPASTLPVSVSTALSQIWVAGRKNSSNVDHSAILRRDASDAWSNLVVGPDPWLFAVWGSGPADGWAGGDPDLLHFDGISWRMTPPFCGGHVVVIAGSGPDDAWPRGPVGIAAARRSRIGTVRNGSSGRCPRTTPSTTA